MIPPPPATAMNNLRLLLASASLITGLCLFSPEPLYAHGALMEYAFASAITIQAKYDTGHPMPGAQITVYSPDDPRKPWLTGTSDEEGRFSFVPDPGKAGTWTVQARQAGHGAMVHIPMDQTSLSDIGAAPVSAGLTTLQRLLMALAVVWGFVGTALFFSRKSNSTGTSPRSG